MGSAEAKIAREGAEANDNCGAEAGTGEDHQVGWMQWDTPPGGMGYAVWRVFLTPGRVFWRFDESSVRT